MKQLVILTMLFATPVFATVGDGETIRQSFTTNGSTTTFTFTFKCNSSDDVLVYSPVIATGLPIAPLVEDTDYTIAPTGGSYLNGGVVTISPALEDTVALRIVRRIKQSQETAQGAIDPTSLVAALDKSTRAIQDAEDRKDRSLHIPESDSVDFDMTLPNAVDRAGKVPVFDESGNIGVTTGTNTFTVVNGAYESISVSGTITTVDFITKGPWTDVRAFDAVGDGSTDDVEEIQAAADSLTAGGVLFFPKTSSFYSISDTIDIDTSDNTYLVFERGAEIRISATSADIISITKDFCGVIDGTFRGQGTYVTTGEAGGAVIRSTGEHTFIYNCYIKEPEQFGIYLISAHSSVIENNVIEGGKYFANEAGISTDRQHYGIRVKTTDYVLISGNKIQPNTLASAGRVIQGIQLSTTTTPCNFAKITNNTVDSAYDHGIYAKIHGSIVSDNTFDNCGMKIEMDNTTSIARAGNTITGNTVTGATDSVLSGDTGLSLANARHTVVSGNMFRDVSDAGIFMSVDVATTPVSFNTITDNVITKVREGNGDNAYGITARLASTVEINVFSNNDIKSNIITNLADATGNNFAIYVVPLDSANSVYNDISGNTINNIDDEGIRVQYLTKSKLNNNIISDVGGGTQNPGIEAVDLNDCEIKLNFISEDAGNMVYGYREDGNSGTNIIQDNHIMDAVTGMISIQSTSRAEGNWAGVNTFQGTATWNPAAIANGAEEAQEITVTGAVLGDFVLVSFSLDVQDLVLDAQVTTTNTVTAVLANNTGGSINLNSGTVTAKVIPKQ